MRGKTIVKESRLQVFWQPGGSSGHRAEALAKADPADSMHLKKHPYKKKEAGHYSGL